MRQFLTIVCVYLSVLFAVAAHAGQGGSGMVSARPILLGAAPSHELASHLEQFVDHTGSLALSDILAPDISARFFQLPGNLNASYTRDVYWLRFTLKRTSSFPEDGWLRFGPSYLDNVSVYIQTGNDPNVPTSYNEIRLGDHVPVAERPVQHPEFVTPIFLQENKSTTVYVRVQSTSVVTLSGSIHTGVDLIRWDSSSVLLQGSYLGITLVIALINLILFVRIGERLFLYFALYVFALFINHLATEGILTLIWPAWAHLISDYLVGIGMAALAFFYSCFAMNLFGTPKKLWAHRYLQFVILSSILVAFSVPLGFYGEAVQILILALLGMIILLFVLSLQAVRNGEPGGRIYLMAFGVSNIGYIAQFLRLLGLIPLAWWNTNAVQFASFLNMVLMTLALTERLRIAEQNAIAASRDSEQKAVELAGEMTFELRNKQYELEKALVSEQEAVEQQTRFLTMLSHEYRTPLAIIQTNLDLLELQDATSGTYVEPRYITMKNAVKRLVEVMEVCLQKGRVGIFRKDQAIERIVLIPFLDGIIDIAEGLWPERFFAFQPQAFTGAVMGDPAQLKTAIFNLLDNACKYSSAESIITIECRYELGMAEIIVTDQGSGISPEDEKIIFEKYCRGSVSHGTSGAGLGLWLVRQVIEQHSGDVQVFPGVERGTIVKLRLPVVV